MRSPPAALLQASRTSNADRRPRRCSRSARARSIPTVTSVVHRGRPLTRGQHPRRVRPDRPELRVRAAEIDQQDVHSNILHGAAGPRTRRLATESGMAPHHCHRRACLMNSPRLHPTSRARACARSPRRDRSGSIILSLPPARVYAKASSPGGSPPRAGTVDGGESEPSGVTVGGGNRGRSRLRDVWSARMMTRQRTLVTGVIGADTHIVGNRILGMVLEKAGYKVVSLGALTPAEEFVKAAIETAADGIMISSLYGQGELDCRGFRDLCIEAGLDEIPALRRRKSRRRQTAMAGRRTPIHRNGLRSSLSTRRPHRAWSSRHCERTSKRASEVGVWRTGDVGASERGCNAPSARPDRHVHRRRPTRPRTVRPPGTQPITRNFDPRVRHRGRTFVCTQGMIAHAPSRLGSPAPSTPRGPDATVCAPPKNMFDASQI